MKQSYFQTPRTLDQCTFHSWADPIHNMEEQSKIGLDIDSLITGGVLATILCFAGYILIGI